jgi:perosamine synthetase
MIPVFRPTSGPEEEAAVIEVLRSGWWGLGPRTAQFESAFAGAAGAEFCVGTSSASTALLMALTALDLDDREVITPAMTFVSTNHAVLQAGGVPVFADIDPQTLTIDPDDVRRMVTPRTAAIMAVDYAGHPADLDALREIADSHGLSLVEDAAHSCGATYRGRPVGSIADLTCFSFHAVKNLAMGEGGAVTLSDPKRAERLRRMRWLGLTRSTWERAGGATYSWEYDLEEIGFKANLSDIPAAIGLVQLDRLPVTNARRRSIAERYSEAFAELDWLATPAEREDVRSAWHMYVVRVRARDRFMSHLAQHGVSSSVHYKPTHLYAPYAPYARELPVTDAVWHEVVTLPLFPGLTDEEVDRVVEAVRSYEPLI